MLPGEDERNSFPLVNTNIKTPNIKDMTPDENRSLKRVLEASATVEGRTGANGALQVQADEFEKAFGNTLGMIKEVEESIQNVDESERPSLIHELRSLQERAGALDKELET